MDTFADRINELIGGKRRRNAFARECGVSETSVRQYQEGAIPGLDKVIQIARAKNVRVEWLATGEGPRSIRDEAALAPERTQQEREGGGAMQVFDPTGPDTGMVLLPRLSVEASAGLGLVPNAEEVEGFVALSQTFLRQIGVDPAHAHVLQVSGRSMVPTINDKDVVVIDTSKTRISNEGIYTLVYGETVLVKRIEMLRDGGINIVSDNKSEGYRDEYVPRSEMSTVRIVGQVKGQVRPL